MSLSSFSSIFNQFLSLRFWLGQDIHRLLLIYKDLVKGSSLRLKGPEFLNYRDCFNIFLDNRISWIRTIMGGSAPTNISSKRFFFLAWPHGVSSGCDDLQEILQSKSQCLTNELQVLLDVLHSVLRFTGHVAVIAALLGFWRDWLSLVIQLSPTPFTCAFFSLLSFLACPGSPTLMMAGHLTHTAWMSEVGCDLCPAKTTNRRVFPGLRNEWQKFQSGRPVVS